MMTQLARFALAAVALTACGSKDSKDNKKTAPSAPAVTLTQADIDAVNALVPADLKATVQFERRTATDERGREKQTYAFAAPKGWKDGFTSGAVEPAKRGWPKDEDSFMHGKTSLWVSRGCDGSCEPKDWAASSDESQFRQYTSGKVKGKVLRDDKTATGRILVFQNETETTETKEAGGGTSTSTTGSDSISIVRASWTQGAPHYDVCFVELAAPAKPLVDAFLQACAKFEVSGG